MGASSGSSLGFKTLSRSRLWFGARVLFGRSVKNDQILFSSFRGALILEFSKFYKSLNHAKLAELLQAV